MSQETAIDAISGLPEEILLQILSWIPSTKLRATTSLISKRWRRLWTSVPSLDFPLSDFDDHRHYAAAVDRSAAHLAVPRLRRLWIEASHGTFPAFNNFDRWFHFASSMTVADLFIDITLMAPSRPLLPSSIFLCSRCLTSLTMKSCTFPKTPPDFEGFPSLKTLKLKSVAVHDETMEALLSSSPLLEDLTVRDCTKLTHLEISSADNPRIVNLRFESKPGQRFDQLLVQAPSLRLLDFRGDISKLRLVDSPKIRTVTLISGDWKLEMLHQNWLQLLLAVGNTEFLTVDDWFFEFVLCKNGGLMKDKSCVFKNLKELHWFGICITECNLRSLISCVIESPLLEKLHIDLDYYQELNKAAAQDDTHLEQEEDAQMDLQRVAESYEGAGSSMLSELNELPLELSWNEKFLLPFEGHKDYLYRLKVVTLVEFSSDFYGRQLVAFILGKACSLELLNLTIMPVDEGELELLHKQFSRYPRASPHARINVSEI